MKPINAAERFIDSNVLLYLLSADQDKANRAEALLTMGIVVSVQVLNEIASVASRKLGMSIAEIRELLRTIRAICKVVPLTEETHDKGLELAERYKISIYDAMIIASAHQAGCKIIWSEDLQDGQVFDGQVKIRNPFLKQNV